MIWICVFCWWFRNVPEYWSIHVHRRKKIWKERRCWYDEICEWHNGQRHGEEKSVSTTGSVPQRRWKNDQMYLLLFHHVACFVMRPSSINCLFYIHMLSVLFSHLQASVVKYPSLFIVFLAEHYARNRSWFLGDRKDGRRLTSSSGMQQIDTITRTKECEKRMKRRKEARDTIRPLLVCVFPSLSFHHWRGIWFVLLLLLLHFKIFFGIIDALLPVGSIWIRPDLCIATTARLPVLLVSSLWPRHSSGRWCRSWSPPRCHPSWCWFGDNSHQRCDVRHDSWWFQHRACLHTSRTLRNIDIGRWHNTAGTWEKSRTNWRRKSADLLQRTFQVTTLKRRIIRHGKDVEVEFTHDWKIDAQQRDLSMNSLSMDEDGVVYDYTNGVNDLNNHHVRFNGSVFDRLIENPIRILRYFRFVDKIINAENVYCRFVAGFSVFCHLILIRIHRRSWKRSRNVVGILKVRDDRGDWWIDGWTRGWLDAPGEKMWMELQMILRSPLAGHVMRTMLEQGLGPMLSRTVLLNFFHPYYDDDDEHE